MKLCFHSHCISCNTAAKPGRIGLHERTSPELAGLGDQTPEVKIRDVSLNFTRDRPPETGAVPGNWESVVALHANLRGHQDKTRLWHFGHYVILIWLFILCC